MRVTRFGAMALGFSMLLLTITLAGCGGGSKEGDKTDAGKEGDKTAVVKEKATPMKPGKGTFKGMVTLVGEGPEIAKLNEELKAQMEKASANDKPHCIDKAPPDQKEEQDWKIGENKGVADVFVYFRPASGHFFAFEESDAAVKDAKAHPPTLDQPHCAFIPHALTAFPAYRDSKNAKKETGQKLVVKNSSEIAHNTKISDIANPTISSKLEKEIELPVSYSSIPINCGVHPWMSATLLSLEHPYATTTNAKGEFEIKNVPAGKVMVVVWHPKALYVNAGGSKGDEIELKDGENAKNFELKVKK